MAGIYAVYDIFPVHHGTGRREQIRGENWGLLPREKRTRGAIGPPASDISLLLGWGTRLDVSGTTGR